ncbi:MAG: glucosaminidase domain-containing protein [Chitinophagales bacterium]
MLILLVSVFSVHAQNKDYINNHKVMAKALAERYGIPAPVILAVAAVESSGGRGPVARVLHNHFGIVGKNSFVNFRGHSSRYKQYPNVFASYLDFCVLITHKRFYHKLKGKEDCKAWVLALSSCGYSEVPEEWTQKVLGVLATIKMQPYKIPPSPRLASAK